MGISDKTRKILWGRSGNRCAICHHELVMNATSLDDESVIGEECHIVAREPNGPRGQSPLSSHERDAHDNLILLCRVHHKLIDDQPNTYDIECLKTIKDRHEGWVRETLDFKNQIKNSNVFSVSGTELKKEDLDNDDLSSALGKDYKKLRDLLAEKDWQAADKEAMALMSEVFGKDVKTFPLVDLKTIDRLWLKYSSGKFGFSVQREILNDTFCDSKVTPETCLVGNGQLNSREDAADRIRVRWQRFGEKLGWYEQDWIMAIDYTQALTKKPQGYLPLLGEPPCFRLTPEGRSMWWWALLLHLQPWNT